MNRLRIAIVRAITVAPIEEKICGDRDLSVTARCASPRKLASVDKWPSELGTISRYLIWIYSVGEEQVRRGVRNEKQTEERKTASSMRAEEMHDLAERYKYTVSAYLE
jgi:hypothetical protein